MMDLTPEGITPQKSDLEKALSGEPAKEIDKKNEIEDPNPPEAPSITDFAKEELEQAADILQGPDVIIEENQKQETPYLEEGSEAQVEALKKAVDFDKNLVVSHDYGSSEWNLITSAINEKIDYRSLTHAMPLGPKGSKGVLIKTMVIMSGSCAVHTVVDRGLKIVPDPKAPNLFILK